MMNLFGTKEKPKSTGGYKAQNQRINVHEDDVRECNDRSTLLNWQIEVQTDVDSMQAQLEKHPEPTDWFDKTTYAHRMNKRLLEVIRVRLIELNETADTAKLFMKVSEHLLDSEMYEKIMSRTLALREE